jgi:type IV pilus assembly protein PilA
MTIPHLLASRRRGGFTLIELMIVVGLIGMLVAMAIPSFLRYQLKTKSSEGKTNLAAIRMAETSYHAAMDVYVSASLSPNVPSSAARQAFVASPGFVSLGWEPEGPGFFTYAVATANGGQSYHATAHANLDGDTTAQIWHYRRGSLASQTHLGATPVLCTATDGSAGLVEACDATSGQTTF